MKFHFGVAAVLSIANYSLAQSSNSSPNYIIKFKDNVIQTTVDDFINSNIVSLGSSLLGGIQIKDVYNRVFKGFSGSIPRVLVPTIKALPFVDMIEEDIIFKINDQQMDAPWGLARISQRETIDQSNSTTYYYDKDGGKDVAVYVIDSGINVKHVDFEGRAIIGKVFVNGGNSLDENGHGTHVSGTIGGKRFGVAKKAQLIGLKVFDGSGSGSTSGIIAAIEWAISDKRGKKGNVINMSLGGRISLILNLVVEVAYLNDFVVVVAAGNSNQDACLSSPASAMSAITVGATNITDHRAYFSNYGSCVDVFAPGQAILSAWNGYDTDTKVISGTSMASPHVAGLAAYLLSKESLSTEKVTEKIKGLATKDVVKDAGRLSPNLLAYNGAKHS